MTDTCNIATRWRASCACKAVLESTGNLWLRIYDALEWHGVLVKLTNSYKTKAIAEARIKTDKVSARILAHLLRADLVAECYVAPREVRRVRAPCSGRGPLWSGCGSW